MLTDRAAIDGVLATLGAQLSEKLVLDDDLQCALLFDDGVVVVIAAADNGETLSVRCPIGVDEGPWLLRRALALNYGRLPSPACIALDEASGQLLLFATADLAGLSGEDLAALVALLVALAPTVRAELVAGAAAEPAGGMPDLSGFSVIQG